MRQGKRVIAGIALAALSGALAAQTPSPVTGQRIDSAKDPAADQPSRQPTRQGVAAPMNMRIRGDGLALPPGVGRDADEQREERRETKPASDAAKKPER